MKLTEATEPPPIGWRIRRVGQRNDQYFIRTGEDRYNCWLHCDNHNWNAVLNEFGKSNIEVTFTTERP